MAIYNVNQNRQFYVVSKVSTDFDADIKNKVEGAVKLEKTKDGKQFWLKHFGKAGVTRTDLIDVDKVCYAKLTQKADMRRKLKKATITLSADVNSGALIPGQDYILRIQVRNYLSPGDASVLIRSGAVHATKGMTAAQFYEKMVNSLKMNFSRDAQPLLEFEPLKASEEAEATGIVITEVGDQPWRLGVLSQEAVNFEAIPTTVRLDGEDVIWGNTEYGETEDFVGNGKQLADLEYFCQAERGDMFRNMGWPNNIDVKPMVDSSKEYDVLDIHYYFSGSGVQVHKSEKDITFVAADTSVMSALKTAITGAGVTVG